MANLESLLNDLANLDAVHDLDGLRRVREQIVTEHPESEAAAEALYKLGLDAMFRQRDVAAAAQLFLEAAKRKHPYWSSAARTSLGLCYAHMGKLQRALLELRKVAYPDTPTAHSVTALSFIEALYAKEGNAGEVEKARKDRIGQLHRLIAQSHHNPKERGFYLYTLGVALLDAGERVEARQALEKAKELGPDVIGADLYRSIAGLLA